MSNLLAPPQKPDRAIAPNWFSPPSAWNLTPNQRIARLRIFIESNKGRKGRAQEQTTRYLAEITEIEEQQNA